MSQMGSNSIVAAPECQQGLKFGFPLLLLRTFPLLLGLLGLFALEIQTDQLNTVHGS